MKGLYVIITAFIITAPAVAQKDSLRLKIDLIVKSINGDAGIAIKDLKHGDTLAWNPSGKFPMQSVFKLPLSIYVLSQVDAGKLRMDQKINLSKGLYYNTWSPIMKKYPEGNVALTLEEVLVATLRDSDNIGCDLLFSLVGGTYLVENYFHEMGISEISIKHNEREMQSSWSNQFDNWCTPEAMIQILERVHKRNLLSASSHDFLWENMVTCSTGPRRIKGNLPPDVIVAHRTGTGGPNAEGVLGAVNDVGIIEIPDGGQMAVVAYIANVKSGQSEVEAAIAKISKAVYDCYAK